MLMRHSVIYSPTNVNQVKFQIHKIEVSLINKPCYVYCNIAYNIIL